MALLRSAGIAHHYMQVLAKFFYDLTLLALGFFLRYVEYLILDTSYLDDCVTNVTQEPCFVLWLIDHYGC